MRSRSISRAIELLTLLQSRRNVTADYLAQALRCSRRTVFRDLHLLREAGFAIWYDELQCTFVVHGKTANRSELTESEWKALLLAAGLSPIAKMDIYGRDVSHALAKLMALVPGPVQDTTNNLLRVLGSAFDQPQLAVAAPPAATQILDAAARRQCLRIVIQTPATDDCDTKLSPFQVYIDSRGWMVRGRSSWHKAVIEVPMAHIGQAEILEETFCLPRFYLRSHGADKTARHPHLNGVARHARRIGQRQEQSPNKIEAALKARVRRSPQY